MLAARPRTHALLLAGGLGTRLKPITDHTPKCLVPITGRPLLDFWIDALIDARITQARINNHAHADLVRQHISWINASAPIQLVESFEPTLLGSAGTVAANADLADGADQILIIYADNLSDIDLRPLLAFHATHNDPFSIVLFHAPNPRACGIAALDDDGRVVSFVEKPENPTSDLANAGIYVLDAEAYREIASLHARDLGFDVLPRFVGRMRAWTWGGFHLDVGTLPALEQARAAAPRIFPPARLNPARARLPRPAVFLDRDGTIIQHVHYLSDPAQVALLPGIAQALVELRRAGFALVVVTNQSAIGRGMFSVERLHQIHAEMNRQLAAQGAAVDAIYFCPDVPSDSDRTTIETPNRKPGPGMLLQAAADLNLDLNASWMLGDLVSDVLAGINAGCRSVLLLTGPRPPDPLSLKAISADYLTLPDVPAAVPLILQHHGQNA